MNQMPYAGTDKLRVMIVEDEPPMLRFLNRLLSQLEDFQVVAQCTGAEEALAVLPASQIDLLISDIRMSGMSGLALAQKVRACSPDMHIVIVTGYKSFEYARTAIPLGIDAFITKPIDQEEFGEVLSRIRDAHRQSCLLQARTLLEQTFLSSQQDMFAQVLAGRGLSPCQVLLLYTTAGHAPLLSSINRTLDSLLYLPYQNATLFFVQEMSAEDVFRYMTVKFSQETMQPATGLLVHLPRIPDPVPSIDTLKEFYRNQIPKLLIPGAFHCFPADRLTREDALNASYTRDATLCQEIELSILSRKWDMVWQLLEQLFARFAADKVSVFHIRRRIHSFTSQCARSGVLTVEPFALNDQIDGKLLVLDSYEDIHSFLCDIWKAHLPWGKTAEDREQELFDRIRSLTLRDLARSYALQEICSIFQVSQPYVRKIFQKYTGKTYHDYILAEKIGYAVRLLEENPQLPVKDLAAALGYEQLYFGTVFKKNVGVSPSQYKQSVLHQSARIQTADGHTDTLKGENP